MLVPNSSSHKDVPMAILSFTPSPTNSLTLNTHTHTHTHTNKQVQVAAGPVILSSLISI